MQNTQKNSLIQRMLLDSSERRKAGILKTVILLNQADIEEALLKFSKRSVWEFMHRKGEFPGSYSSFLNLVRKYIEKPQQAQTQKAVKEEEKKTPEKKVQFEPQPIRHFIHNPNPDPKDLW